jgi:hypothetical protein
VGRGRLPLWLKVGFTLWILAWVPFYCSYYGPENFLWFCDIGNFVLAWALWKESALLFSWQAVSVLLVQLVMVVDMAGRLVFGRAPIGATDYFWDGAIPLHIRLLSLFHVVTPFLMIWGLRRLGYDRRGLRLQLWAAWVVLPVCFIFTAPEKDINWVWGPLDRPQTAMAPALYFAVCLAAYPLLLYFPSHLALARLFRRAPQNP